MPGARALLFENIDPGAKRLLEEQGFSVEQVAGVVDPERLADKLAEAELIGIRSQSQVTDGLLERCPSLLAVGAFCIGVNQIDLPAATRRGVAVFNAPFSNTRSVVELAIAEIIALTRRLTDKNAAMHAGSWDKSATGAHEVRGRRLGIGGYGNIGIQLSVIAENLGMSVFYFDIADRLAPGNAKRCATLHELLESVDIVTLHVDGRPENTNFFGKEEFARMRDGAIFLNLSRGFVVDHQVLRECVESGRLAGAAIDVFPEEPSARGEPFVSELRGVANVILTPHIGGSTEEAQVDIGRFVAHKLIDYAHAGTTTLSVNMPNVELAPRAEGNTVVHIHHNTPGVLARIDGVFAENKVNIERQALGTRADLGYVLTDLDSPCTPDMLDRLAHLDDTIRVRAL